MTKKNRSSETKRKGKLLKNFEQQKHLHKKTPYAKRTGNSNKSRKQKTTGSRNRNENTLHEKDRNQQQKP